MDIRSDDPRLRLEATRGFRKILSVEKNPPVTQVLQSQCLPILVSFLACQDMPELQFEAAWALTNIASTDYTRVSGGGCSLTGGWWWCINSWKAEDREKCPYLYF